MIWANYWKNMNFELDKIKKYHRMFLVLDKIGEASENAH